jgi:hypothetical protein
MLWSQFSAIFSNFRRKNGVFLKYQCYGQIIFKFGFVSSQKRQFLAKLFCKNIFKIITSVPGLIFYLRNPFEGGCLHRSRVPQAAAVPGTTAAANHRPGINLTNLHFGPKVFRQIFILV